jgi:DNA-binding FadR family transcriptional regulator
MSRRHREILDELLGGIASGTPRPGAMLPKEEDLAEQFKASRGVIRESMRALEERGVATVKHGRGATIEPPERWHVLDPAVARAILAARGRRRLLKEAAECHALLGPPAAGLAARHATEEHVVMLRAALAEMRAATGGPAQRRAQHQFHRTLTLATANRPLASMLAPLHDLLYSADRSMGARPATPDELERVVDAIGAGDPDRASTAMRAHLEALG